MNATASSGKRRTKTWILAAVVLLVAVAVLCGFFRIHTPKDLMAFSQMAGESHPVWRQFAFRRFGPGDSTAELVRRFPPTQKEESGRYGRYLYEPGSGEGISFTTLWVGARDGRIINAAAGGCTWRFKFFEGKAGSELQREERQEP